MRGPRNVSRCAPTLTDPARAGIPLIRVFLEVRRGDTRFTGGVRAESIEQAIGLAIARHPGCEVRVLFPIDPEAFFAAKTRPAAETMQLEMFEEAGRIGKRTAGSDTNESLDGAAAGSDPAG